MKWREFEKSIPSWYHLEEHCRLSIREYWLSWSNRVAEAKIEITHLILNGDPVYHLEEQGERGREEGFGEIHDRHPTPRLSQVRCNHVNLLKKWDDWKISTKEKVGPKIHSEKKRWSSFSSIREKWPPSEPCQWALSSCQVPPRPHIGNRRSEQSRSQSPGGKFCQKIHMWSRTWLSAMWLSKSQMKPSKAPPPRELRKGGASTEPTLRWGLVWSK